MAEYEVECALCGHMQDVGKQFYVLEREKRDLIETHCSKCKMVITVVYTMFGLRCLETMIKNKESEAFKNSIK